jgi:hypothetical protein
LLRQVINNQLTGVNITRADATVSASSLPVSTLWSPRGKETTATPPNYQRGGLALITTAGDGDGDARTGTDETTKLDGAVLGSHRVYIIYIYVA